MNRFHHWYCRSGHWRLKLQSEILPWAVNGLQLAAMAPALEIGPGPGLTTEWLCEHGAGPACLEIDPGLALDLRRRLGAAGVRVYIGDATQMPFDEGRFSIVLAFTMLHHIPSRALQDRMFREAYRVLQPGGILAGVDSSDSWLLRLFHIGDRMLPLVPSELPARLEAANFANVQIDIRGERFRFLAYRPPARVH